MTDSELRFAAEFGRSVGRWDWWNLRKEHTPFQWALQRTIAIVQPYGERRADMRAATMTANLMAMQSTEPVADDNFREMIGTLTNYLKDASDYEEEADIAAARQIARKDE